MSSDRDRDDTLEQPTQAASPGALSGDAPPIVEPPTIANSSSPKVVASTPPSPSADQSGGVSTVSPTSAPSLAVGSSSIAQTSLVAPIETLRLQEIARTRAFVRLAFALSVAVGVLAIFIGGDPLAKRVLYIGLGTVCSGIAWLGWLLRRDEGYTVGRALIAAYAAMMGAFCSIYFFGAFSPAPMVLPFGLFFFSAAQSFRATMAVYVTCALLQAALMIAMMTGLLVDRGLISAGAIRPLDQSAVVVTVELILLATFLIARATRQATLDAIERHDHAVRGIAQREALLREAKQDLERALKFGGLGRFTETTLGSYRLGKILGRGGMGEVYEATHVTTHEAAAVKLLHAHILADPDLLRRFMREAKIAATLVVPNVVRVVEIGGLDAPVPYIAMERLRGEDLADHLRRHRSLSIAKTLTLVRQVGHGLVAARGAGIVHRDLKPRNLFYAEEGLTKRRWKILDFGVSKLGDGEGTQTKDMIIGTPAYMAPEQAKGAPVSYRTDLYALGVIAYRVLTGRPAFTGEHTAETLYQVVYQMPPRPSEIAKLDADVDLALAIAIAKDPAARFDSAAELADALEAAHKGKLDPGLRSRGERLLEKLPWGRAT